MCGRPPGDLSPGPPASSPPRGWTEIMYHLSLSRVTTYWPISCPSTSRSSPGCEGLVARGHDSSLFFPPTPNTCV